MELTRSELRHTIRGTLNALRLCVSALEMPLATPDKLEFLSDVESAAQRLAELVVAIEDCPEPATPATSGPVRSASSRLRQSV